MDTALGLIGLIVYVTCTVAFAAGVTWLVVKAFPQKKPKPKQPEAQAS